jgi:prevent-host-death family protein
MKADTYSTYEAKARLSEILRKVRRNKRVVITHHGKPVAEIGPISPSRRDLEGTLADLENSGILSRGDSSALETMAPVVRKPGALKRFLENRD